MLAGCGGATDSPDSVVQSLAGAYAKGDIAGACKFFEQEGEGRVSDALYAAAADNEAALKQAEQVFGAMKPADGVCPPNLMLLRRWDPAPDRAAKAEIRDVDSGDERATVSTSVGTWELHEVDGEWRVSKLDPLIPAALTPR